MNKATEQEMVRGCNGNNRQMQQQLYETFYGKMLGVCMRYSTDSQEAKDILQDGFLKAFQNIKNYTGEGSLEGWIRRIIVNLAIDKFRKKKHHYEMMELTEDHDTVEDNEENIFCDLRQEDILGAVQELSPVYRTVFNLYVFENLSHKEIADQLGISVGASKSNLAKARQNLQKMLKEMIVQNG